MFENHFTVQLGGHRSLHVFVADYFQMTSFANISLLGFVNFCRSGDQPQFCAYSEGSAHASLKSVT